MGSNTKLRTVVRPIPIAILAISFSFGARLFALDPAKSIGEYGRDLWQSDQGLPHNSVRAITQTPDGYLWLATSAGIARFDGSEFELLERLGSDVALSLTLDPAGRLLVGTFGSGILQLQGARLDAMGPGDPRFAGVQTFHTDSRRQLWFGSQSGLWQARLGPQPNVTQYPGLVSKSVRAITHDAKGTLWVGTTQGLFSISGGSLERHSLGGSSPNVASLFVDRQSQLWVGTDGDGLFRREAGQFRAVPTPNRGRKFMAIKQDRDGNIWFATWDSGMARLGPRGMEWLTSSEGLPHDQVMCLFEDREGSIWAGTRGGGLIRFREHRVKMLTPAQGLPHKIAWAARRDPAGNVWIGTDGGLVVRKDGGAHVLTTRDGLANDSVVALAIEDSGAVWAGSLDSGLTRIDGRTIRRFGLAEGLSSLSIRAVLSRKTGEVWVATAAGIDRYLNGRFYPVTITASLPFGLIRSLNEDRAGALWISTTQGAYILSDTALNRITTANGLSSDSVRSIFEDSQRSIWIATAGGGLNRFRDGKVSIFRARNGLPDDDIYAAYEDDSHHLWLSSAKGITRISLSEFDRFASGDRRPLAATLLGVGDGMRTVACTLSTQPAGFHWNRTLWVPTLAGVAIVDTTERRIGPPPLVAIRQILVDRSPVDAPDRVTLPRGRGDIEFVYTALTFIKPSQTRFRYMLSGFDPDWIEAGTRRTAWYTNLPAGNYRFRVQALDAEGVWSESDATQEVVLSPPIYQTPWFIGIAVIAGCALMAGAIHMRMRSSMESERKLTLLVERRTAELTEAKRLAERAAQVKGDFLAAMSHEIRTPLNGILGTASLMANSPDPSAWSEGLKTIRGAGEGLLCIIDDILDMTKIEAGRLEIESIRFDLSALLTGLIAIVEPQAFPKGLALETKYDPDVPRWVSGDANRLRQILLNLLGNAVKFTHTGRVSLHVYRCEQNGMICFAIADTGIGIPGDMIPKLFLPFSQADMSTTRKYGGTGLGLAISGRLVNLMGGNIELTSQPGLGSRFVVSVPLEAAETPATVAASRLDIPAFAGCVLVVDDTASNRLIATRMLERLGFETATAEDGRQAVRAVAKIRYDAILMDCLMPDLDGFGATIAIRANEKDGHRTPIIALTASAFDADRRRCLEAGMDDFLAKPIRLESLADCLARWVPELKRVQSDR